jgi:hypothetical protein
MKNAHLVSLCQATPSAVLERGRTVLQVLTPMQAAVMLIQAETDPVEPMHISNLVAVQKGIVDEPPDMPPLTQQEEEVLMKPYRSFSSLQRNSVDSHVMVAAAVTADACKHGASSPSLASSI